MEKKAVRGIERKNGDIEVGGDMRKGAVLRRVVGVLVVGFGLVGCGGGGDGVEDVGMRVVEEVNMVGVELRGVVLPYVGSRWEGLGLGAMKKGGVIVVNFTGDDVADVYGRTWEVCHEVSAMGGVCVAVGTGVDRYGVGMGKVMAGMGEGVGCELMEVPTGEVVQEELRDAMLESKLGGCIEEARSLLERRQQKL